MDTPLYTCARPLSPDRTAPRSGVALVVTLGILAMICVAVIAFIAAMRLERATARLEADRATLRGLHHVALASAMQEVTQQLRGRVYPVTWHEYSREDGTTFTPPASGPCFGSFYEQEEGLSFPATTVRLFSGAATNLVPGAAHADAAAVESVWLPVTSVLVDEPEEDQPADPLAPLMDNVVIGRVAYLVIDCSGFLPPVATNRLDASADPEAADAAAAGVGPHYAAQAHLPPERRDLTFYLTHDPDPEQRFTVRPEYADKPFGPGLFSTLVTNKFDLNCWTNGLPNLAEGEAPLAFEPAAGPPWLAGETLQPWFDAVAQEFFESGFYEDGQAEKLSWNLLNLLDADRLPQYRRLDGSPESLPPSRVAYGFEDLPMINEVAVSNAASAGYPAYSVSVELWYPFEPEQSPENLVLAVGVYTNRAQIAALADVSADPAADLDLGPFGFTHTVPLQYSPGRQFHVAFSEKYVRFAPEVVDPADTDDYRLGASHPLYVWPRLYLLCTNTTPSTYVCVDEALFDAPSETASVDGADILEWRSPGSWQARNPFFNLVSGDGDFGGSPTLWARNDNLDAGFEYPLFHLNRPLVSVGELGYLGLAQAGTGTVALAAAAGAALLDRFTALPTNRLERASASRIQPNSPYPDVIASLFADPVFSRPVGTADIPSRDTLTNAWFAARMEEGWNTFAELLPAFAAALTQAIGEPAGDAEDVFTDASKLPPALLIEDLLRGIPEQSTFRQNLYVILVAAQRLAPSGRATGDQRAAITVIRDAYTGRWAIHDWIPLDE